MKKIISVLALSTLVFGSATAKKSVKLNYRNGATLWQYANNGETRDPSLGTDLRQSMSFFNLNAYNGGADALNFSASGDVLGFETELNPTVNGGTVGIKKLHLTAQWGAFGIDTGILADGKAAGFQIKKDMDAGNWEGAVGERFKLGSSFSKSYANYSDSQNQIKNLTDDRAFFTQLSMAIAVPNSDAEFKLLGTLIWPEAWQSSNEGAQILVRDCPKPGDSKDDLGGHIAGSAFVIFSKPSVFKAQAFAKFMAHCNDCATDQVLVPGAYFQFLAVPGLETTFGASMSVVESTIQDFNFDLRARYATGPLSITYFGNVSAVAGNWDKVGVQAVNLPGLYALEGEYYSDSAKKLFKDGKTIQTHCAMWNFLSARFKINDTFAAQANISALTDLANGINQGPQKAEGTTLSITPAVQIFAASNASILIGFNATMQGIGKEEHPVNTAYKNNFDATFTQQGLDLAFAVPVLFRVKM